MKIVKPEADRQVPFGKSIQHHIDEFDMSPHEAIKDVQGYYSDFKKRNERLLERQSDQSNSAQISLLNQSTLAITATLTIGSAFVGSVYQNPGFSEMHKLLFAVIVVSALLSLTLALKDYRKTISFHDRWAKAYYEIDTEVDKKFDSAELQLTSDLGRIEALKIEDLPQRSTSPHIIKLIDYSLLTSVWLFFVLVITYFYDVPLYHN
jgi:endoglucanase Acf2